MAAKKSETVRIAHPGNAYPMDVPRAKFDNGGYPGWSVVKDEGRVSGGAEDQAESAPNEESN